MSTDLEVALKAARAAADVLARMHGRELQQFAKSDTDFATEADIASELAIRAILNDERPLDAFEGEETGLSGTGLRRWLVDPLCGTLNYAAGTQIVAINIALLEPDAAVRTAVSADPFTNEFFWADDDDAQV